MLDIYKTTRAIIASDSNAEKEKLYRGRSIVERVIGTIASAGAIGVGFTAAIVDISDAVNGKEVNSSVLVGQAMITAILTAAAAYTFSSSAESSRQADVYLTAQLNEPK
jgi:hypothetical protein